MIGFDSDNYEIFEGFEVNAVLSVPVEILNGTLASGVIYPVQVATEGLEDQPNVATGIETTQSCTLGGHSLGAGNKLVCLNI